MPVEDHQAVEQLIQVLRRREAEELTALLHKAGVVREDVPGTVGGVALKEVVDGPGLKVVLGTGWDVQHIQGVFRLFGQIHQLLLVGQCG